MSNGDDLWKVEWPGVVIRVRRAGPPDPANPADLERIILAPAEKLDTVWAKAAREFFDPLAVPTPPMPGMAESLSRSLESLRAKRTRGR